MAAASSRKACSSKAEGAQSKKGTSPSAAKNMKSVKQRADGTKAAVKASKRVVVPAAKRSAKAKASKRVVVPAATKQAWNKGKRVKKTGQQFLYVPREDLPLFFAVATYFAGPVYAIVLWLTLVTSRRISEALLLRGSDVKLAGGEHHDEPHVLFQRRPEDKGYGGQGKMGCEQLVARISEEAVQSLQQLEREGQPWIIQPCLEPYQVSHPEVFTRFKALRRTPFHCDFKENSFLFPSHSVRRKCRPCMARQTVWKALDHIRQVLFELTKKRRYNPSAKFQGERITVHGATRHTSAALLLHNHEKSETRPPSEHVVLEIQQRSDARVFRDHYCHAHESEVKAALDYGAAPGPFGASPSKSHSAVDEMVVPPSSTSDAHAQGAADEVEAQRLDTRDRDARTTEMVVRLQGEQPRAAQEGGLPAPSARISEASPTVLDLTPQNTQQGDVNKRKHDYVSRNAGALASCMEEVEEEAAPPAAEE
ncbi:unnamed protein product [Symbiodinium necroappetens]|uniref:Uncharacterized protein n=1 Tax=Symbiodinium necroappetens TaxID=1628268 RepID=A0A812Z4N3_9DINO|nr:unnamed protein product [Symbiodinium necroappetens]CAE7909639.1 unnamed protein product [Symbiodinium microadriaticum]